jgi:Ca-activated chloride channel family protein
MRSLIALLGLVLVLWSPFSRAHAAFRPSLALQVVGSDGQPGPELPLEEILARVQVSGTVARTELTQVFANPYRNPLEALYSFPLPADASVSAMRIELGTRVIRAVIQETAQARKTYEEARSAGRTAALLEQHRPNVFTQSVTGIRPGERVRVVLTYEQRVERYRHGYRLSIPTTVGPRCLAHGAGEGGPAAVEALSGASADAGGPAAKLSIAVELRTGIPLTELTSPTHQIAAAAAERAGIASVHTVKADERPDRDFVLQWSMADEREHAAVLAHHDGRHGYFMLHLEPSREGIPPSTQPREMIFVVDCSGSMAGSPLQAARAAIARCLTDARPEDTIDVVRFSDEATLFRPVPVPCTASNRDAALAYVDALQISGGTDIKEGVRASLRLPVDPARKRIVAFFTDGFIGDDTQVLAEVEQWLGQARVFAFGVGPSTNHFVIDGMARIGRGAADYVPLDSDPTPVADHFHARLADAAIEHLELEATGVAISDTLPRPLPDLIGEQPCVILGRYERGGPATFTLKGRAGDRPWSATVQVELPEHDAANAMVRTLWAREMVRHLTEDHPSHANDDAVVTRVKALGLEYELQTAHTSFVAVDERVERDANGRLRTVRVPALVPRGMSPGTSPASGTVNAAPEPGEWALMLLGAGLMLWLTRRQEELV